MTPLWYQCIIFMYFITPALGNIIITNIEGENETISAFSFNDFMQMYIADRKKSEKQFSEINNKLSALEHLQQQNFNDLKNLIRDETHLFDRYLINDG